MKTIIISVLLITFISCSKYEPIEIELSSFEFYLDYQDNLIELNDRFYSNWDIDQVSCGNDTISVYYSTCGRPGSRTDFEFFRQITLKYNGKIQVCIRLR